MDIRSNLDGLKTLLGIMPAATTAPQRGKSETAPEPASLTSDRATLSSAGGVVAQSAQDDGVRSAKVAEIQAALQAGTYSVPASAVASSLVDAMLERGK